MRPDSDYDVFAGSAKLMDFYDQKLDGSDVKQQAMYAGLIVEEYEEWFKAVQDEDDVEQFDALIDMMVVILGYGHSKGFPMAEGWAEVMRSNMSKIDPDTGRLLKRGDGKVLKPAAYSPPDLASLLTRQGATK